MNYTPSRFANLPQKEKAFVIACIENRIEAEKREARKIKVKPKGRR